MSSLSPWIGPAIVAAVISAVITAIGWYASHVSSRGLEVVRRREGILDVQTALRAEIRTHRQRLLLFRNEGKEVAEKIGAAASSRTSFTPFIPREIKPFVFDAVVANIHILPTEVIDPVVYYYAQLASIAQFADDLRSERYQSLEPDRKLKMYEDYVAMGLYALELAEGAIKAIEDDQ